MMMMLWCCLVWEVRFHPSHPTHLFTCSNDGSLWHWDSSDSATTGLLANTVTPARGLDRSSSSSSSSIVVAAAAIVDCLCVSTI